MQSWMTLRMEELPLQDFGLGWGAVLAIGVLYCFLGYRLFRFILGLTGFLLAGTVAAAFAGWVSQGHLVAMGIVGVLGGICGAVALYFLYRTGVFFLGFLGALLVAYHVLQTVDSPWRPWFILGAALTGGLLALWLERPVMTLATAVIGAWMASWAAYFLLMETRLAERAADPEMATRIFWAVLAGCALLTALGAAFQFSTAKKKTAAK